MSKNMANVDSAKRIVDFHDKPVSISLDVENCPLVDGIGARKSPSHICQASPGRLFRNAKPRIEWRLEVTMLRPCFLEPISADDVHAGFLTFAICEDCTSQIAKMSMGAAPQNASIPVTL